MKLSYNQYKAVLRDVVLKKLKKIAEILDIPLTGEII